MGSISAPLLKSKSGLIYLNKEELLTIKTLKRQQQLH
jgi:hypothetical protein